MKTRNYVIAAVALLAVAFSGSAVWEWMSCLKAPAKVELVSPVSLSKEKAGLGDTVSLHAEFRCDWPTRPGSVVFKPGEGVQSVSAAKLSLRSVSWGRAVYSLDAVMQPYRTGTSGEGSLRVAFSKASGSPDEFDLKVPSFAVEPLKVAPDAKLSIAGKLKAKLPLWIWLVAGAVVVAVAALLGWLVWRRLHKVTPPPPPWTQALDALSALRRRLSESPDSVPSCLAELTDILRRYLEARFQLHACTQTSFEFLSSLDRGDGPLTEAHRSFLKEFLLAADMVKFALAAADRRLLDDAILRAEKLVHESVPAEPASGREGAK